MIPIQEQWAIQIEVTNACPRACSNCTRLLAHAREPFYVSVDQFTRAVEALADFPSLSPPSKVVQAGGRKVVGMMGGEPLWHPDFARLCNIMERAIPDREQRGLWTGLRWQDSEHSPIIRRVFGFVNNNLHEGLVLHSPVLVAICDVVQDPEERSKLIADCWLQQLWAGSITPKGLFFCEVAGAMDVVFDGPGGLPVEPGCWRRPLSDFQEQIDRWCPRCGIPLNLIGRRDREEIDDVSTTNLASLSSSPRITTGRYEVYSPEGLYQTDTEPWEYRRGN